MATMIDGESSVGRVLMRPLSHAGDLRLYCWPLRCLKSHMGGPPSASRSKGKKCSVLMRTGPAGIGARAAMIHSEREAPTKTSLRAWSRRRPSSPGPSRTSARTPSSSWRTPAIRPRPRRWTPRCWPRPSTLCRRTWSRKAISVRTPSPKACWWSNDPAPSLAALSAGCVIHFQGRPYGSCGPHRCHGDRVEAAGGGVDHGRPRDRGRPVRQPLLRVRRAWKGTVCPRYSTRQQVTRRCKAMSSTEMVCVHGAHGRPRWESSTPCSAIARAEQGVNTQVRDGQRRSPLLIGSSSPRHARWPWRPPS
jgi:hypothetical protein